MKNILDFLRYKNSQRKISMISCHSYWQSKLISQTEVDCLLVGDSVAMLEHGYDSTIPATMDMMVLHTRSVVKGANGKFVVADMPFLSYRKTLADTVHNAGLLMQVGANAIKLEGADGNLEHVRHLVDSGIPVMGHLGLTPQSVHQLGGFKIQAKESKACEKLLIDAKALENAGCFSLVLECVPYQIAKEVAQSLTIPVIGIGAGPYVDGQVLVFQDMMGLNQGFKAKFLKTYHQHYQAMQDGLNQYHQEVLHADFPSLEESYDANLYS